MLLYTHMRIHVCVCVCVRMQGGAPVDDRFPGHQSYSVFQENGVVWDAMLNQVRVDASVCSTACG